MNTIKLGSVQLTDKQRMLEYVKVNPEIEDEDNFDIIDNEQYNEVPNPFMPVLDAVGRLPDDDEDQDQNLDKLMKETLEMAKNARASTSGKKPLTLSKSDTSMIVIHVRIDFIDTRGLTDEQVKFNGSIGFINNDDPSYDHDDNHRIVSVY